MKIIKTAKIGYLILCFLPILFFSCNNKEEVTEEEGYYTCSMHPQVREEQPGDCPICGMDLIKVSGHDEHAQGMHLSEEAIILANIQIDTVEMRGIGNGVTLSGITTVNENSVQTISSRIPGRIERLYFKNTGERIKAGQVLYDLYSEELLSAQREYLLTLEKQKLLSNGEIDYGRLLEAAKNKLLLWGMTEDQVGKLKTQRNIQTTVPIRSKGSGIIMEINIREGDYVKEGSNIFKLADLSSLWVEAELYAHEVSDFQKVKEAEVRLAAFPNKIINGAVIFTIPETALGSKINIIRTEIPNNDQAYAPGMQATVTLNTAQKRALAIPLNAVIREANMDKVWIQNQKGNFEARMVTLGLQNNRYVEVESGLHEGEMVVVSGAYLLNSEYIFRNGAEPMAGMEM